MMSTMIKISAIMSLLIALGRTTEGFSPSNRSPSRTFRRVRPVASPLFEAIGLSDGAEPSEEELETLESEEEFQTFINQCNNAANRAVEEATKTGDFATALAAAEPYIGLKANAASKLKQLRKRVVKKSDGPEPSEEEFETLESEEEFRSFMRRCVDAAGRATEEGKKKLYYELGGKADLRLKDLKKNKKAAAKQLDERLAPVNYGLTTKFDQYRDLKNFQAKVADLFEWHNTTDVRSDWIAPYFPIVQSSGLGKTKLMYELRQSQAQIESHCFLLQCVPGLSDSTKLDGFDNILSVPFTVGDKERQAVTKFLDDLVGTSEETRVVLLLDEAQHLLGNDGWAFRVVCWWLRIKNPLHKKEVVAVFTGTSSRLTEFFKEPPTESTTSRDIKSGIQYYETGQRLLDPFYEITTIGSLSVNLHSAAARKKNKEYDEAVLYGRPLFALFGQNNDLFKKEAGIMRRMLLSPQANSDWSESQDACFSALATRLQMGQTSLSTAGRFVANGYASLTYYSREEGIAHIAHWPDPVLARLSMCFMLLGQYKGPELDDCSGKELSMDFWAQKVVSIFSSGLCYPDRGDLGEFAGALYLLQCGDALRLQQDENLRTLSVPVESFVRRLLMSGLPSEEHVVNEDPVPRISFIQVCRNDLRHCQQRNDDGTKSSTKKDSTKARHSNSKKKEESIPVPVLSNEKLLGRLYRSSVATYNCANGRAYDILAAIKLPSQNFSSFSESSFLPFSISIKSVATIAASSVQRYLLDMLDQMKIENARKGGICVLLMLNCDSSDIAALSRGLSLAAKDFLDWDCSLKSNLELDAFDKIIEEHHERSEELAEVKGDLRKKKEMQKKLEESQKDANLESEIDKLQTKAAHLDGARKDLEKSAFAKQNMNIQEWLEKGRMIPIVVGLEEGDILGISNIVKSTTIGPARSEILSSHPFVRGLSKTDSVGSLLRAKASQDSPEYGLLKALIDENDDD